MNRMNRLATLLAGMLLLAPLPGAVAEEGGQRLYLMADHGDYLYWTPDPDDPELPVEQVVRACGQFPESGLPDRAPCRRSAEADGRHTYMLDFLQGAVLQRPVVWDEDHPLRFHLELDVEAVGDPTYDVQVGVSRNDGFFEGGTSQEVAPGVWEGELAELGEMNPVFYHHLYVKVIRDGPATDANPATLSLATRGASWIELPATDAVTGGSTADATVAVPALLAADGGAVEAATYSTPTRSFEFNDADWAVHEFAGTDSQDFTVDLDRPAAAVIGWVDAFETAAVYSLADGDPPDPTVVVHNSDVRLLRNGEELAHGGRGGQGWGADVSAAVTVPPGPLTLEVRANHQRPFTAHLLVLYGERTLAALRYRFANSAALTQVGGCCGVIGGSVQSLPTTPAVQTFSLDLTWDGVSPAAARWVPGWAFANSPTVSAGDLTGSGTGPRVRATYPRAVVWSVYAALASDRAGASYRDTVFELKAEFTHSPRPAGG